MAQPATREDGGFAQKERQHPAPRRADRPQHANLLAPRDHRHRHRVVDEEQPDDQRDVRQRREVEVKGGEHLLDLRAPPRRPLHAQAGRQPFGDVALERV